MIKWKVLTLTIGLVALALLPWAIQLLSLSYLPGFTETVQASARHYVQLSLGDARLLVLMIIYVVFVSPISTMLIGAGLGWRAIRQRERVFRQHWVDNEAKSTELVRAWLSRITEAAAGAIQEQVIAGYQLLGRLSPRPRHLLEFALQGETPSDLDEKDRGRKLHLAIRVLFWSAALMLGMFALFTLLFIALLVIAHIGTQAEIIPRDLRLAHALTHGLSLGWWSVVVVAGAIVLNHIEIDRSRWRVTQDGVHRDQRLDLRQHARDCLARIENGPASIEAVKILRAIAGLGQEGCNAERR